MATKTIHIERLICDRCDVIQDCDANEPSQRAAWGKITAQGKQGAVIFAGGDYSKDLCPKCCVSLADWSRKPIAVPVLREI